MMKPLFSKVNNERGRTLRQACLIYMLVLLFALSGCAVTDVDEDSQTLSIYYINNSETAILSQEHELKADPSDAQAVLSELIGALEEKPAHLEYEAPIDGDTKLTGYSFSAGLLTLNFSGEYYNQDKIREILSRAAIVRTLTQADGVESVVFQVEGAPLTGADGSVISSMNADTFIYNAGNEINTYEKIELKLFFANESGESLMEVYRSVVYNSNISMQRLAVEQLIGGPNIDIAFPTINPAARINSISVNDGICYVDLDSAFLTQPYQVRPEVAVYSIVNTLTELPGVNKVQISVDGNTGAQFMETMNLGTVFERNLDLVD